MLLKLIDWFSVTTKVESVEDVKRALGMENSEWEVLEGKGAHGYQNRTYFESINIFSEGREGMGVWLEMTGEGCRAFESFGHGEWERLFLWALEPEHHITRIDAAVDDKDGILPLKNLARDTLEGNWVGRFRKGKVDHAVDGVKYDGMTIYFGSPTSDIRMRIYDKAKETGREEEGHWVRCELQMRDMIATAFAENYLAGMTEEDVVLGVLKNYIRFVIPSKTDLQNRDRWKVRPYWKRFLGKVEALRLWSAPGMEYNLHNLKRFVLTQAGNSIRTFIEIEGKEKLLQYMDFSTACLPERYRELIDTVSRKRFYEQYEQEQRDLKDAELMRRFKADAGNPLLQY